MEPPQSSEFSIQEMAPAVGGPASLEKAGLSPVRRPRRGVGSGRAWAVVTLIAFLTGLGGGYLLGTGKMPGTNVRKGVNHAALSEQVHPPGGYAVPARYGDIGPKLLAAGAIDDARFEQLYEEAGQPLSEAQHSILHEGKGAQIIIDKQNAYFLLNFLWALGLANQNPILTQGPMVEEGQGAITGFASTGGWTLANRPVAELYASAPIITLTPEQQTRLETVARQVYRPCCNNPTHFPDCNHGMAMLGLLELMASQDAGEDEMFEAAKYANAFWYPRQSTELAAYFQAIQKLDFAQVDSRELLSAKHSSGSGFQAVHQWLAANGGLEQLPGGGSSCGV